MHSHSPSEDPHAGHPIKRRMHPALFWLCALVLIGIVGTYVWTEHRRHVPDIVFWTAILACPLIHLFMHKHHGGHGGEK